MWALALHPFMKSSGTRSVTGDRTFVRLICRRDCGLVRVVGEAADPTM